MNWKRTCRFSSARARARRWARTVRAAFSTTLLSSSGVNGLARKSKAPFLVALTATSSEA